MVVATQTLPAITRKLNPFLSTSISPFELDWQQTVSYILGEPKTYFTDNCSDFKHVNFHLPPFALRYHV